MAMFSSGLCLRINNYRAPPPVKIKALLYSDVEHGVVQNVHLPLTGEQQPGICDQPVPMCAALRHVFYAQRLSVTEPYLLTRNHPDASNLLSKYKTREA